ncbi:MAG: glycosyltransferase [Acidobacteria bacterium]|nr:glycosyltransferase [Acidobacteriota bacterium]
MNTYEGTLVVIPTRNRADLAANAIRSVLAQSAAAVAGVVVSDNSTDPAESSRLAAFCEAAGDARLRYVRPPQPLLMAAHWDWAASRALELCDASHVSFLTDRIIFRDGALAELASVSSLYPDKIVSYMHDKVADDRAPVRLQQSPWSGKLYEIASARLLYAVSQSRLHEALPRMLNCHVPRAWLVALRARYGNFFASTAPDFSFCFRALASEESVLFLDEALLCHYALSRSNGMSIVRGEVSRDNADLMAVVKSGGDFFAAPIPGIVTVHNVIVHEYGVARDETGGEKFAPLDEEKYLQTIAAELADITNPEARRAVEAQLRARGWVAPTAPPDLPLWRKLLSPSRVRGKLARALRGADGAAAAASPDEPAPPIFESVEDALDYARTSRGERVEQCPWAEYLEMKEVAWRSAPPGGALAVGTS